MTEQARATGKRYAHMCRDEHIEIGHNDSEHEMCPLCRVAADLAQAEAIVKTLREKEGVYRDIIDGLQAKLAQAEKERDEALLREARYYNGKTEAEKRLAEAVNLLKNWRNGMNPEHSTEGFLARLDREKGEK